MYRSTQELLTAVPEPVVRCAQVLVLVLLLLALAACERGAGDRPAPVKLYTVMRTGQISVAGSAVMAPLLEGLARQYEQLYPGISVTVTVTSAMEALVAVRNGRSMIGMLARTLRDEESDLQGFPIARDGVALVALAGHPLMGVNRSTLEGMLLGRLPAAGPSSAVQALLVSGEEARVAAVLRARLPAARARLAAGGLPATGANVLEALRGMPAGMALMPVSRAQALLGAAPGELKLIKVDAYAPSARNLRRGLYPLLIPLSLVTRELPQGEIKAFLDFCLSAQAAALVARLGFVAYVD